MTKIHNIFSQLYMNLDKTIEFIMTIENVIDFIAHLKNVLTHIILSFVC